MNKTKRESLIPDDDNFFTSAASDLTTQILPHIFCVGIKEEIQPLPFDWLASLQAEYASKNSFEDEPLV